MAQIVSREQPQTSVTVAELLRRCAPAPELDHNDAEPIPVGALLRREGRRTSDLPHIPDLPKAAACEPPASTSAWTNRSLLVRRGAIAAGALVAAGSVFGLTTAMHATGEQPAATGSYPGEGALDGTSVDTPSTSLDSGAAAPTSWMPVAFPTALGGSTIGKHALAPTSNAVTPAIAASPVHASTAGSSTRRTAGAAATSTGGGGGGGGGGGAAQTTQQLGNTVGSVGQGTPVAGVTSAVGTTVADAGKTLDSTATPVVSGVVAATTPVVAAATPVVSGATSTVSSVTTTATGAVGKTVTGLLG